MKKGEPYSVRPIRIEGDIAYVPLTKGHEAIIDAADVPLVAGRNWHAMPRGGTVYAARSELAAGERRCILMHRVILAPASDKDVDHKDCNGLNNRRSNLRSATRSANLANRGPSRNNRLGRKGVRLHQGRYAVEIMKDGRSHFIGSYDDAEEASAAYAAAASALFGPFARAG